MSFAFCVFAPSVQATTPKPRLLSTFETFAARLHVIPADVREGNIALWSPATYNTPHRSAKNVESISCLVLDFDDGATPEHFEDAWEGLERVCHTTYNHTADHPRWRVIFPLSSPVPASEWPAVWRKLAVALGGNEGDEACKDASRFYFLPGCPPERLGIAHCDYYPGEPLDPATYPDLPDEPPRAPSTKVGTGRPGDVYEAQAQWQDILALDGWQRVRMRGEREYWRRPGKAKGISATLGGNGVTGLYVFSSNAPVPPGYYSKFSYYAFSRHGGNFKTAAKQLVVEGYVERTAPANGLPAEGADSDESYHLTDMGNASRFADRWRGKCLYVPGWPKDNLWGIFESGRWEAHTFTAIERGKETALSIYDEIKYALSDDAKKAMFKHALKSESAASLAHMLSLAESIGGMHALPDEFNRDDFLLGVPGGVLDLRTGEIRDGEPGDMITKQLAHLPADDAGEFPAFVRDIMDGSEELERFLQKSIGYSLTGCRGEQIMYLLYGKGSNGKNCFIDAICAAFGDYARESSMDTWLVTREADKRTQIVGLVGARMVLASEADEGRRLSESLIKSITGDTVMVARHLHCDDFVFTPKLKLWFTTNHLPRIKGQDHAIWRRIVEIPFNRTYPIDPEFKERIMGMGPQILRWAVDGCLLWQKEGLRPFPAAVTRAVEQYKEAEDILTDWMDDCLVIDKSATSTVGELHSSYRDWAAASGENGMSETRLGRLLDERGYTKSRDEKARRCRIGLRLKGAFEPILGDETSEDDLDF
ncbi:MAG: DNA primase family protein [Fimbriimonadales bacterium]